MHTLPRPVVLTLVTFTLALSLAACATHRSPNAASSPATGAIPGTVTGLSSTHGNVYTSITPDQYGPLGLTPAPGYPARRIILDIADHTLTLPVHHDYTDVPVGEPLAVLHREGLTFAIRDGNFSQTYHITPGEAFTLRVID